MLWLTVLHHALQKHLNIALERWWAFATTLSICPDGDKSLLIRTPRSRHVFTVNKTSPFIPSGLRKVLFPICRIEHLLTEMGNCHVSAHLAGESKAHCSWSILGLFVSIICTFTSSANKFSLSPNFFRCFIKSLIKIRNNSGPIPLPWKAWTIPLISSSIVDNDNPTRVWWVRLLNKKLRYREEHSASVVLSWCTLWHFSGENLLMANQPLLRNWPQKVPNSAK